MSEHKQHLPLKCILGRFALKCFDTFAPLLKFVQKLLPSKTQNKNKTLFDELVELVIKKDGKLSDEAKSTCQLLCDALSEQNIYEHWFEYSGGEEKALSLHLVFDDDITMLINTETENNDGTVNFEIIYKGETLVANYDNLVDFKEHLEKFFYELSKPSF